MGVLAGGDYWGTRASARSGARRPGLCRPVRGCLRRRPRWRGWRPDARLRKSRVRPLARGLHATDPHWRESGALPRQPPAKPPDSGWAAPNSAARIRRSLWPGIAGPLARLRGQKSWRSRRQAKSGWPGVYGPVPSPRCCRPHSQRIAPRCHQCQRWFVECIACHTSYAQRIVLDKNHSPYAVLPVSPNRITLTANREDCGPWRGRASLW